MSALDIAIAYPDGPGDTKALSEWVARLPKPDVSRLIVLGKTEGPATLNDFSRDLAHSATDDAIAVTGGIDLLARSWRLFSTGCEGIAAPNTVMIADIGSPSTGGPTGMVIGVARSEPLPAALRCGMEHIDAAAQAVARAIDDAMLEPSQVSLVLIKSPVLMPGHGSSFHAGSTGSSRGAAALGAGIALGEIDRSTLGDDPVRRNPAHARRAMAFSGTETDRLEVVVFGERPGGDPAWGMVSTTMTDMLDSDGPIRIKSTTRGTPKLIFFKAGIAPDGRLRGRRTTVFTSDLTADKQLRAAASGLVAAHFGNVPAFISGGTEHQAAPGGCLCAAIVGYA